VAFFLHGAARLFRTSFSFPPRMAQRPIFLSRSDDKLNSPLHFFLGELNPRNWIGRAPPSVVDAVDFGRMPGEGHAPFLSLLGCSQRALNFSPFLPVDSTSLPKSADQQGVRLFFFTIRCAPWRRASEVLVRRKSFTSQS